MKTKRKSEIGESKFNTLSLWILLLTACLVPLLVRISQVNYPVENIAWVTKDQVFFDVYSLVKANAIILLGAISTLILGYKLYREKLHFIKSPVVVLVLIGMMVTVISALFSKVTYTALFGFLERYEGTFVILSYFMLFLLSYKFEWNEGAKNKFYKFFFLTNFVLSIIGIMQYFGFDPLTSSFLKPFITSFDLSGIGIQTESSINYRVIGQTLYHYNYVSFFSTLSLPIFLTRTLYEKNLKVKLSSAFLSLLILFNLFGSSARGGMVGLSFGFVFFVILNWKLLFANIKLSAIILLLFVISFVGFEMLSDGFVTKRFSSIFKTETENYNIKRVYTEENSIYIDLENNKLRVEAYCDNDGNWTINSFLNDQPVNPKKDVDGNYAFAEPELNLIHIQFERYEEERLHLVIETDGIKWPFKFENNNLYLRNIYGHDVVLTYTNSYGFEGHEKAGSARGYIWSRTLPLIDSKPFLGYGPDTFALVFPQEDYIGKYYSYGTQNMIVDKAHNVYLQQAMNSGIISLLVYISLMLLFIGMGLKNYVKDKFDFDNYMIPALLVSIASYSVAGLFNDSSVHVAPVYWVMLGMGLSLVYSRKEAINKIS